MFVFSSSAPIASSLFVFVVICIYKSSLFLWTQKERPVSHQSFSKARQLRKDFWPRFFSHPKKLCHTYYCHATFLSGHSRQAMFFLSAPSSHQSPLATESLLCPNARVKEIWSNLKFPWYSPRYSAFNTSPDKIVLASKHVRAYSHVITLDCLQRWVSKFRAFHRI